MHRRQPRVAEPRCNYDGDGKVLKSGECLVQPDPSTFGKFFFVSGKFHAHYPGEYVNAQDMSGMCRLCKPHRANPGPSHALSKFGVKINPWVRCGRAWEGAG